MTDTLACPTCGAPLDFAGKGETIRCPYCNSSVIVPAELRSPTSGDDSFANNQSPVSRQMAVVTRLARAGNKIEAIKLYRGMTHCGLAEAKAVVDDLAAGKSVPFPTIQPDRPPDQAAALSAEDQAEVLRLLQAGQKIEAIKLYRLKTGLGLKQAKDAVDAMGGNITPQKPTSSLKARLVKLVIGLFFLGLASIFPIVFGPMIVSSWQEDMIGAAIGTLIGVLVWVVAWGGIGVFIIFM